MGAPLSENRKPTVLRTFSFRDLTAGPTMKILLLTPPLVQLNTPYPATPVLTGFLRSRGADAVQADLSLELVLRLFSRDGLRKIAEACRQTARPTPLVRFFLRPPALLLSIGQGRLGRGQPAGQD